MQVYRTNKSMVAESSGAPLAETVEAGVAAEVEDFFTEVFPENNPTALPQNPFDLMAPSQASVNGLNTNPVVAPQEIPTLEEILTAHPELQYDLDLVIKKYESKRDNYYIPLKNEHPSQAVENAIITINQQIQKAQEKQASLEQIFISEKIQRTDLNGDGILGNPKADDHLIIAHHRETGEIILLDKNKNPVPEAILDMEYKPAIVNTYNLELAPFEAAGTEPELGTNGLKFDLGLKVVYGVEGLDGGTFGAVNDFSIPEFLWVKKGEDGKPLLNDGKYVVKEFVEVTREDGEEMIGQEPPVGREELGKWVQQRVSGVDFFSEKIKNDSDEGFLHVQFKDERGRVISHWRVEGTYITRGDTEGQLLTKGDSYHIAATTVGLGANAGKKEDGTFNAHSSRYTPVEINAKNFHSTGQTLAAFAHDKEEMTQFFEELGMDTDKMEEMYHGAIRPSIETVDSDADPDMHSNKWNTLVSQSLSAISPEEFEEYLMNDWKDTMTAFQRHTLVDAFKEGNSNAINVQINALQITTVPGGVDPDYPNRDSDKLAVNMEVFTSISGEVEDGYKYKNLRHAYLGNSEEEEAAKSGIYLKDLRGNHTGTGHNDIMVIPRLDFESMRQFQPMGISEPPVDDPLWATYADAGGGRNIITSAGDDIYASGATVFSRHPIGSMRDDSQVYLKLNNSEYTNYENWVYINDSQAETIAIDNGEDQNAETKTDQYRHQVGATGDEENYKGDDYFDVPIHAEFTNLQIDLPDGMNDGRATLSSDDVRQVIRDAHEMIADGSINNNRLSIDSGFNIGDWEITSPYVNQSWEEMDSFFGEWEWFTGQDPTADIGPGGGVEVME